MKILLTGASGFIGGRILKSLKNKYGNDSIVVLSSRKIPGVECYQYKSIDSFDLPRSLFSDVTHVIHAGAFTPKDKNNANEIDGCYDNLNFLKQFLSFEFKFLKRFINLSTLDVYSVNADLISEESAIGPVSLYAASKYFCENMVQFYCMSHKIDFLNLRIGHVYGPGEEGYKKILPVAIRKIIKGEPIELWGDGMEKRSFIYIDDVVDSIVNALIAPVKNVVINVVSGNSITINDLISKLIKISGSDVAVCRIPSVNEKRDLVFNNKFLLSTLLEKEKELDFGILKELEHMKKIYENNI